MEVLGNLFEGYPNLWGGGVMHSVLIPSPTVVLRIILAEIKVWGVSLRATWVLFVGTVFGYFNMNLGEHLLYFLKGFGLALFAYSVGLQVGPGFFSASKKGGFIPDMLVMLIVVLGITITIILHFTTGIPITAMVGTLPGAVTNTPGLGAVQQANSDLNDIDVPEIALGYVVSYPLGVVGIILSLPVLKYLPCISTTQEEEEAEVGLGRLQRLTVRPISIEMRDEPVDGIRIKELRPLSNRKFVISRIKHREGGETELVSSETILHIGDIMLVISTLIDVEAITVFFGKGIKIEWEQLNKEFILRRILVTKPELNGKTFSQLKIRNNLGTDITRVNRPGVDLIVSPQLQLQMGDCVTIVGSELVIAHVEKVPDNSMKHLNHPNPTLIFIGIVLGCTLGSLPFTFSGTPQPVRLGLAGGPPIVSTLTSCFSPGYKLITYAAMNADLMFHEISISIFLACVGLGASEGFADTVIHGGGCVWIGCGVIITILPPLITGLVGRHYCKLNCFTLIGVLVDSTTDPLALACSNGLISYDVPTIDYAMVYPLTMFLQVLVARILILSLGQHTNISFSHPIDYQQVEKIGSDAGISVIGQWDVLFRTKQIN